MTIPVHKQVLLLPERRFFRGQMPSNAFVKCARRFCFNLNLEMGETAQLQRYFQCIPKHWPMAAICRQYENSDAYSQQWLRADPIFLQMEMRGARVMAWDNLDLQDVEKRAILHVLKPVFGDAGFELCFSKYNYFTIRALEQSQMPELINAPEILGCSLSEILPKDKRWLSLFNECQIILHNHPLNVERQRNGLLPINALWFWGAGTLPTVIYHHFEAITSTALDLTALDSVAINYDACEQNSMIDLRSCRDWQYIELAFNPKNESVFDFADGVQWIWHPNARWHFWRRAHAHFE